MRAALVQMTSTDDPAANLAQVSKLVDSAITGGAQFVLTPECTNMLSSIRAHQSAHIVAEGDDPTLAALRQQARWQQDPLFAHLSLAINVSARQFLQDDFVAQVLALVLQEQLQTQVLTIWTESNDNRLCVRLEIGI